MSHTTVIMTLFTGRCAQNIFISGESMCYSSMNWLCHSGSKWVTYIKPIRIHFLTEICFFDHITFYSVHFTCFALLSHQWYHDIPLFKARVLYLICRSLHLGVVANEMGSFGLLSTTVANLYIYIYNLCWYSGLFTLCFHWLLKHNSYVFGMWNFFRR